MVSRFVCTAFTGPLDLLMVAMAPLVGIPLSRLWWYHVHTILGNGLTTNEDIRSEQSGNFSFDRGSGGEVCIVARAPRNVDCSVAAVTTTSSRPFRRQKC